MSILPDNLTRYQKFLSFMLKYWNSDLLNETASNVMEEETARRFEDYEQSPEELVEDLKEMGPTYVKLGQLLSTRPDLLPDKYLEALASLQDDLPAIPYLEIRKIVENEIGTKISKAFNYFEEEPLASASIGQVHRAELRSGKTVAVKVQRPGIRKKFLADLDTLEEMAEPDNLAKNEFRLQIDAIDEKRFTDGFQKVANRITLGLIIAAMIIGAAMLMSVPSPFMIFGYPGLAILFFILAAVAAIYLSYMILFKDE